MATYTVEVLEVSRMLTLPTEHADILPARQTAKKYIHESQYSAVRIVQAHKDGEKVVDEWVRDDAGRMVRNNYLNPDPRVIINGSNPKESMMAKAKKAAEQELLGEEPVQTVKKGKAKDVPAAKSVAEDLLGEEPKKAAKKAATPAKPKETIEERNARLRRQAQAMKERAAAKKAEAEKAAAKEAKAAAKEAKAAKAAK